MPAAGQYRERVTIQANTPAVSDDGQPVAVWSTVGTRAAAIRPVRGGESHVEYQRRAEIDYVIRLRHDSLTVTITPEHRLLWGTRELQIVRAFDRDGRRREIEIEAIEALPDD